MRIGVLPVAVAAMLSGLAPAAHAGVSEYELGLEAAANYRYAETLAHFLAAAERGDRNARRAVGLMLLYGDLLYGQEVPRDREQGRRWLRLAADDGCEVSASMIAGGKRPGR